MSDDNFYQSHWIDVEPERRERYEAMFQWRDASEPLIAPADISAGQTVVDYGCGPGGLAIELARRVGADGQVYGVDLNAGFLETTRARAAEAGVEARLDTRLLDGDIIPLDDATADRLICKNVLEYVPDPARTLDEFHRVLKPGGVAHVIDSDWGAFMYESGHQQDADDFAEVMRGAQIAFRTPHIGRRLYGLFRQAGFGSVQVRVLATPDVNGGMRSVLTNMASYARQSGDVPETLLSRFSSGLDAAVEADTFFAMLPQFLVTGVRQG